MPSPLLWKEAYASDKETSLLFYHFLYQQPFAKNYLSSFLAQYRHAVTNNSLGIVEGRLVFFEKFSATDNRICRIVVPISLRRIIFSLLHASPTTGYVEEYKTLYRVRLRLFWPRMCSEIYQLIKKCPHCRLTFHWRRRGHELMLSWPVSSLFAIIHVFRWMSDKYTNSNGNMALMNAMCDMSQFVVGVPVTNESSATFTENFSNMCL